MRPATSGWEVPVDPARARLFSHPKRLVALSVAQRHNWHRLNTQSRIAQLRVYRVCHGSETNFALAGRNCRCCGASKKKKLERFGVTALSAEGCQYACREREIHAFGKDGGVFLTCSRNLILSRLVTCCGDASVVRTHSTSRVSTRLSSLASGTNWQHTPQRSAVRGYFFTHFQLLAVKCRSGMILKSTKVKFNSLRTRGAVVVDGNVDERQPHIYGRAA